MERMVNMYNISIFPHQLICLSCLCGTRNTTDHGRPAPHHKIIDFIYRDKRVGYLRVDNEEAIISDRMLSDPHFASSLYPIKFQRALIRKHHSIYGIYESQPFSEMQSNVTERTSLLIICQSICHRRELSWPQWYILHALYGRAPLNLLYSSLSTIRY